MPHLSPMNWILFTCMFWLILLILIPMIWWQQTPEFPSPDKPLRTLTNQWNWS